MILVHTHLKAVYAKPKSAQDSEDKAVSDKTGLSSSAIDEIKVHGLDPEQVSK